LIEAIEYLIETALYKLYIEVIEINLLLVVMIGIVLATCKRLFNNVAIMSCFLYPTSHATGHQDKYSRKETALWIM